MVSDNSLDSLIHSLCMQVESAGDMLIDIANLLDIWSEGARTGASGPLDDPEARKRIRGALIELIDRNPTHPMSATAIWALGKLYDPELEPYLANLITIFVQSELCAAHIRQTIIALDNLELLETSAPTGIPDDPVQLRALASEYLSRRKT